MVVHVLTVCCHTLPLIPVRCFIPVLLPFAVYTKKYDNNKRLLAQDQTTGHVYYIAYLLGAVLLAYHVGLIVSQ